MIPCAAELAAVIRDATSGITVYDHIPVTPSTPSIYVGWPEYVDLTNGTLGGQVPFDLPITFCVGLADARAAQEGMGRLIYGDVPNALERHRTDAWHSLQLVSVSNTRPDDNRLLTDLNVTLMVDFRKASS